MIICILFFSGFRKKKLQLILLPSNADIKHIGFSQIIYDVLEHLNIVFQIFVSVLFVTKLVLPWMEDEWIVTTYYFYYFLNS